MVAVGAGGAASNPAEGPTVDLTFAAPDHRATGREAATASRGDFVRGGAEGHARLASGPRAKPRR